MWPEARRAIAVASMVAGFIGFCLIISACDRGSRLADDPLLLGWSELATDAGEELVLGTMDGPTHSAFGKVSDAGFYRNGAIYVVDEQAHAVRMFSESGDYLTTIGREGDGPGELRAPTALALTAAGLAVSDARGRVSFFEQADSSFTFVRRFGSPMRVWDMCWLGDAVAVAGVSIGDSSAARIYEIDGRLRDSFGDLYPHDDPIVQETLSWGSLACDPETGGIAFAPIHGNRVELFTSTGLELWSTLIPGFRQVPFEYEEAVDGRIWYWSTPEGVDTNLDLFLVRDRVVLQTAWKDTTSTAPKDYQGSELLIFDRTDGRVVARIRDTPIIVDMTPSALLTIRYLPFPRVSRLDMPAELVELLY